MSVLKNSARAASLLLTGGMIALNYWRKVQTFFKPSPYLLLKTNFYNTLKKLIL
jgi:hypothetical protein